MNERNFPIAARRDAAELAMHAAMLERAADFYRDQLARNPRAGEYLAARGIDRLTAATYGIGYAPRDGRALKAAFPNYHVPALADCGLVVEYESGRRVDRFRNRIMFPIRDEEGRLCGFGGRLLAGRAPKYLNSPETTLFQKGALLFGLATALPAINAGQTVIVTEGYFDVACLAQHGFGNVVATLGTAVTRAQIEALLQLGVGIVLCFDGDAAGKSAARRTMATCLDLLGDRDAVSFIAIPSGHDPDNYLRAHGADAFAALLARPVSLDRYLMEYLLDQVGDISRPEERSRFARLAWPWVACTRSPRRRQHFVDMVAMAIDMDADNVMAIYEEFSAESATG